ncbi:hypothetical protein MTO96_047714 [Rhipicephalus appendiculatus]
MKNQYDFFAGELLPRSFHVNEDRCSNPSQGQYCFRAGDERVNEHPGLTAIHTTFLRHHNRIANYLGQLNFRLSDEEIFPKDQFQHIVYSEWLPIVVGPDTMIRFGLAPLYGGYTTNYVSGGTTFELQNNYFFPFDFYNGSLEPVLRGLMQQRAQAFDRDVTDGVTNHLYRLRNESFGLDLVALNLQRAREHGIRPYADYFYFCSGINLTSFDQLKRYMDSDSVEKYKLLYKNVRDVDLFTAGISEFPVPGGVVGPTFACILANMFYRLKYGDRFYYEHGAQAGSLTRGQLDEIRLITFAKIICENTGVTSVTPNVFRPSSIRNQQTACYSPPRDGLRVMGVKALTPAAYITNCIMME